jgi:hypothetical protein
MRVVLHVIAIVLVDEVAAEDGLEGEHGDSSQQDEEQPLVLSPRSRAARRVGLRSGGEALTKPG